MALDGLYVVDLKQAFGTQDIHNIFTYQRDDAGFALDLNEAFVDTVVPAINQIQHTNIVNVGLRITNLGNLGDNWEVALTGGGVLSGGEMLPLHDAVNYTLKTTNRAVRPGSKRFAGIGELYQNAGTITDATYIGFLNALKPILSQVIEGGGGDTFTPVVVKRVKYEVPDSDPVRFAYRFPEIGETPVQSTIAAVLLNTHVSTQVSRK